jgi:hypothetical protein
MNENIKLFYPLDMFEFIHHPEYGCCNLKGLRIHEKDVRKFGVNHISSIWTTNFNNSQLIYTFNYLSFIDK